jgi:hypothetical protein
MGKKLTSVPAGKYIISGAKVKVRSNMVYFHGFEHAASIVIEDITESKVIKGAYDVTYFNAKGNKKEVTLEPSS